MPFYFNVILKPQININSFKLELYRRRNFDDYPAGIVDENWLQTWIYPNEDNRIDNDLIENLSAAYESFV